MLSPRRAAFALAASAALFAATGALAHAAPPPTLTGETVSADVDADAFGLNCSGGSFDGTNGATGPYAGSDRQTGSVGTGAGKVSALSDAFAITAPNGRVTGGVQLLAGAASSATCDFTSTDLGDGEHTLDCFSFATSAGTLYQATIDTGPGGRFVDRGRAAFDLTGVSCQSILIGNFKEAHVTLRFRSDLAATQPTAPTTKDQCKKDGWKLFPQFKNQGSCVSFVATRKGS